jgi:Flp pilus assembly protein TadG
MRALLSMIGNVGADRRGNVAVIFALALLPMLSAVGCAIDYSRANQLRSKLLAAADAASVGSIAKKAPAFIAAGTMTSDGAISVGVTDAQNIFDAIMTGVTGYTLNSRTPTVTKSGSTLTSTVTFSASMPTMFMGIVGQSAITLTGTSTSTANMPLYIDFYLLLDNSPSMGVGATPDDVAAMVSATSAASYGNNRNCAFACHDTASGATDNFYALAKSPSVNVTMRIDVLRSATQALMDTAAATQTYSNQFRMAIYDFGDSAQTAGLNKVFALSSSLSSAKTAAGTIDLMTVNGQNDNNDRDTQFSAIFPQINREISTAGTGTSSAPLKYLFFVSDGVADEDNQGSTMCNASPSSYPLYTSSNRCQSPINPALCQTLKSRGVKVAVLYTTYNQLTTNNWYMTWLDPFNSGPFGPSPNSKIAQNMQACASPGFYFEVSPTQGISNAMDALFKKALADAHIAS